MIHSFIHSIPNPSIHAYQAGDGDDEDEMEYEVDTAQYPDSVAVCKIGNRFVELVVDGYGNGMPDANTAQYGHGAKDVLVLGV